MTQVQKLPSRSLLLSCVSYVLCASVALGMSARAETVEQAEAAMAKAQNRYYQALRRGAKSPEARAKAKTQILDPVSLRVSRAQEDELASVAERREKAEKAVRAEAAQPRSASEVIASAKTAAREDTSRVASGGKPGADKSNDRKVSTDAALDGKDIPQEIEFAGPKKTKR